MLGKSCHSMLGNLTWTGREPPSNSFAASLDASVIVDRAVQIAGRVPLGTTVSIKHAVAVRGQGIRRQQDIHDAHGGAIGFADGRAIVADVDGRGSHAVIGHVKSV